ncbi:MAG: signal peptidase II [Phycisphaerae bacterium]|nr:signal peptidase II [Phycisphaerae bacterium]
MKSSSSYLSIAGSVAVAAFALDQATKALAAANAEILANGLAVAPGFNFTFHRNTGVSFGLLDDVPSFALVALALAIIAWLAVRAFRAERLGDAIGYGLILGGAIGNVTDRLRFGGVTDFLDFYVRGAHWPAFNLADTAIFCGLVMLLLWSYHPVRRQSDAT